MDNWTTHWVRAHMATVLLIGNHWYFSRGRRNGQPRSEIVGHDLWSSAADICFGGYFDDARLDNSHHFAAYATPRRAISPSATCIQEFHHLSEIIRRNKYTTNTEDPPIRSNQPSLIFGKTVYSKLHHTPSRTQQHPNKIISTILLSSEIVLLVSFSSECRKFVSIVVRSVATPIHTNS